MARSSVGSRPSPGLGKTLPLLAGFVATSMLAGVLTAGLYLPAVGAVGQVARGSIGFFDSLPAEFTVAQPSQQSRILYADGTPMATFYNENRIVVPLKQISPVMRQAIVAIEDQRFYDHSGADPQGILRALVKNASSDGRGQGASTLTQQWIKNVLLSQALQKKDQKAIQSLQGEDKARKIREIKLAESAEKRYSKDQILENYLNIALFGDGQFGVQTASRHFFSKDASQLDLQDAALLAGVVRSPTFYNPLKQPEHAQSRRNLVLDEMLRQKIITPEQHAAAKAVPIAQQLKPERTTNGCSYAGGAAYFCEYVTHVIRNDKAFGSDPAARKRLLNEGGLTIRTTLDPRRQGEAQNAINSSGYVYRDHVGAALSSVDSTNGHIVAMAQNREYSAQETDDPSKTAINYNVDAAYGGGIGFQVGSTYKPFTLVTWLNSGRGLNDVVNASKVRRYFRAKCDPKWSAYYSPSNAEGGGSGPMTVLQASYNSVNTAYASMASKLDLCDIRDTAASLGVHRADGKPLKVNASSFLGDNEIAPLSMAGAYGAFANGGIFCKPIAIIEVKDATGKVLPKPEADCHQVISPEVTSQVDYALSQVLTQGTAKRVGGIGRPAAGKTGTTNNSGETWFTGFSAGGLSTAVWVGTPDPERKYLYGVYGATVAAPIWRRYMSNAVDGMPYKSFSEVTNDAQSKQETTVPRVVNLSENEARQAIQDQGLADGPIVQVDNPAPAGTIVGTSPKSGSRVEGRTEIRILMSNGKS